GQPSEQLVPGAASLARALGGDPGKLRDVRAGGEEERLAGDHRCGKVTAFELRERTVERGHRGLAEERRLRVVLAVVDRDERDVARAGKAELSLGQGSPIRARRPCPCR